ncbi:MAG: hypothetical protein DMF59_08455 [Acidobacteria bacterium]|nr:MAG: hypothetical protein DMF59_08455 [Acidobacteriota bacterium]
MSLRIFHVIFITVSIALTLFVTIWGVREYMATRNGSALALAIVFLAGGVALVLYAGKAFRKLKDLS